MTTLPTSQKPIAIMGTPVSSGNRGVLALGSSLINLCTTASSDTQVVLLLGHRDNKPVSFRVGGQERMIPIVNCRLSPKARLNDHLAWIVFLSLMYRLLPASRFRRGISRINPWIRTIEQSSLVGDVRGGDSFSDIYGMKRFLFGFLTAWSVILVKGSIVQFPQTYGPYKSPIARWLTRYLLKRSSVIIARDKQSLRVAQELVRPRREVLLCPDVAFSLEVVDPGRIILDPSPAPPQGSTLPAQESILGLNVNGLMFNGGYSRDNMFGLKMDYAGFLSELVTALLKEHTGDVWLVPHTFAPEGDVESDPDASRKLRDSLPGDLRSRVRIVVPEYDQHEIKGVIGRCEFFIGSRMHACIAALSQGIPCVGVAYSMKFAGVFESVGMEEWVVDGREASNGEAVERVLDLYRQRNGVRKELTQRAEAARAALRIVFQKLVGSANVESLPRIEEALASK